MRQTSLQLEELLLALELLSVQGLNELVAQSKQTGLPLGRTLVLSGIIRQEDLERLLKLQAIYQGCKIPVQLILDAYRFASSEGLTVEQGLAKAGVIAQIVSFSRLGTILVDAKLITKKQLDECQQLAYQTKFPLGKMLTMHGAISDDQLMVALDVQRRMRDRLISKDEALAELAKTKSGLVSHAQPVVNSVASLPAGGVAQVAPNSSVSVVNVSELLLVSGILSEQDAEKALDLSFTAKKSMEEVFIESGVVSEPLLQVALELQEAISSGDLCLEAASETLAYIAEYGTPAEVN